MSSAMIYGAALSILAATAATPPVESYGVWRNPKNSVHVEVKRCGAGACGEVVWANEKAKADARKGGTPNLVGTSLFRNFARGPDGVWKGKVFVPDLNRTFTGTAQVVDPDTIRAKGCALGGLTCKSQDWKRVSGGAG